MVLWSLLSTSLVRFVSLVCVFRCFCSIDNTGHCCWFLWFGFFLWFLGYVSVMLLHVVCFVNSNVFFASCILVCFLRSVSSYLLFVCCVIFFVFRQSLPFCTCHWMRWWGKSSQLTLQQKILVLLNLGWINAIENVN